MKVLNGFEPGSNPEKGGHAGPECRITECRITECLDGQSTNPGTGKQQIPGRQTTNPRKGGHIGPPLHSHLHDSGPTATRKFVEIKQKRRPFWTAFDSALIIEWNEIISASSSRSQSSIFQFHQWACQSTLRRARCLYLQGLLAQRGYGWLQPLRDVRGCLCACADHDCPHLWTQRPPRYSSHDRGLLRGDLDGSLLVGHHLGDLVDPE